MPASPQTWAIPVPICPAPITPTFEMFIEPSVLRRIAPAGASGAWSKRAG